MGDDRIEVWEWLSSCIASQAEDESLLGFLAMNG